MIPNSPQQIAEVMRRAKLQVAAGEWVVGSRLDESVFVPDLHPRGHGGEWVAKGMTAYHGHGADGYFLGALPVPVGHSRPDSPLTPEDLRGFGDAIREGVTRHPEIVDGYPPLGNVGFASETNNAAVYAGMVKGVSKIATAYGPGWSGQRIVINDIVDFAKSPSPLTHLSPASRTPKGMMTHELGHAFARVHDLDEPHGYQKAFTRHGITVKDLHGVSAYAAASKDEGFAEMYAQQFTPGFQIEDPVVRRKFLALVADLRADVPEPGASPVAAAVHDIDSQPSRKDADDRDTPQQKAILRQNKSARRTRSRYPAGTKIVSDPGGMKGEVLRHIPSMNAQGGSLRIRWENGRESLASPVSVKRATSHPS